MKNKIFLTLSFFSNFAFFHLLQLGTMQFFSQHYETHVQCGRFALRQLLMRAHYIFLIFSLEHLALFSCAKVSLFLVCS